MTCSIQVVPTVDAGAITTIKINRIDILTTGSSFTLPAGSKEFSVTSDSLGTFYLAFSAADTTDPTKRITIGPSGSWSIDGIGATSITLYFRAVTSTQQAVIITGT